MTYRASSSSEEDEEEKGQRNPVRGSSRRGRGTLRGRHGRRNNNNNNVESNDDSSIELENETNDKMEEDPNGPGDSRSSPHGKNNNPKDNDDPSPPRDDDDHDYDHDDANQPSSSSPPPSSLILEEPDADTLRIMVSTDNHLGYAETDNVRGNDSFAALEEVLYLAKEYSCDMVLLAGDLFHENRPSRRTLYRTMDIFRRYCMGPGAIQVQIVSGSTPPGTGSSNDNYKSSSTSPFVRGYANYEDENYSVDLPVFSIHGNHDDPSRDGGNSELYAALDLLDVANLVNYFGKQEDTADIRIDPVLLRKGTTKVALYGLGSMRDERLNRMWKGGKLVFSRPSGEEARGDNGGGDDEAVGAASWFNIFALHQNRDRGRGTKNCIKEDMIPEWIDLVCWGHEHECDIEPNESVVGTFRISQPGSSVATSLVEGESVRKKIGVLDVREGRFRLTPIPLTQVRSFAVSTIKLADQESLDPDDPKADSKVTRVLEEKVRVMIHDAREDRKELLRDAALGGNGLSGCYVGAEDAASTSTSTSTTKLPVKHSLYKEDEVLIRLKVDHTGFAAVNNQRFGAKFVGDVANPTDILLFTRKKSEGSGRGGSSSTTKSIKDIAPIEPAEIDEMNIEELIVEQFETDETAKLNLFDDKKISMALDSYVGKQEARAINEALETLLGKQQNRLIRNGSLSASEGIEATKAQSKAARNRKSKDDEDDFDEEEAETIENGGKRRRAASNTRSGNRRIKEEPMDVDVDEDGSRYYEEDDTTMGEDFSRVAAKSKPRSTRGANPSRARGRTSSRHRNDEDDYDEGRSKTPGSRSSATKRGRGRSSKADVSYQESEEDEDASDNDDRYGEPYRAKPAPRARAASSRGRGKTAVSYQESEEEDVRVADPPPRSRRGAPAATRKRATRRAEDFSIDDESDDDGGGDIVVEDDPSPPRPKRARAAPAPRAKATSKPRGASSRARTGRSSIESASSGGGLSQSQLSFRPINKNKRNAAAASSGTKAKPKRRGGRHGNNNDDDDSDSEDGGGFSLRGRSYDDDGDDWGTAKSGSTF